MSNESESRDLVAQPRLAYPPAVQDRFNIDKSAWKALVEAIFNNATSSDSVVLALAYCKARGLDPFKRQCHIVPIWDKKRQCMVDTVWPGIAELRTTAFRTGLYAGRDPTSFGHVIETNIGAIEMTYPEWAQITVFRLVNNHRVPFPGPRVYWAEAFGRKKNGEPNEMWAKRPSGQLEKCAEAAALRGAFPEEIGNDLAVDEVGGWDWHGRPAVAAESQSGSLSAGHVEQARQQREGTEGEPQEPPFNPPTPEEETAAETSQVNPAVDKADGVDEAAEVGPNENLLLEAEQAKAITNAETLSEVNELEKVILAKQKDAEARARLKRTAENQRILIRSPRGSKDKAKRVTQ